MPTIAEQLENMPALNQVVVPDLWQQQAVGALRNGHDVVVQAPTGSGKTLIFELWSNFGKPRGQAIYTVPTRALANDKLAEWRARGWQVGIATGDLAENLRAPVVVATLETQKTRLIQGDGPALLVVDEYQMIADPDRGLNYELAIALAPPATQLLLLSGSVANPHDVVKWLHRLGRKAVLVKHEHRPVPLEEVFANQLNYHVPAEIRGYWPRFCAKALAEDLGPILIFAPRRQATEALAAEVTRYLPTPNPLSLAAEQKQIVGEHLARMLKNRIAYHHSGLSYAARAGVIEPLAKAGQLRVVVATMGLAAGINFSLRSVALAGESYRRDQAEQPLRPDEILQMFGRAGRRGIDEIGYVIVTPNEIRMHEGYPCHLSRNGMVDWGALLGLMAGAASQEREPFAEAVRVQDRLFSSKPIFLGVEESLRHPGAPCGLKTDAERARHVRKRVREFCNSRGEWEPMPVPKDVPLRDILVPGEGRRQKAEGGIAEETASATPPHEPTVRKFKAQSSKLKSPSSSSSSSLVLDDQPPFSEAVNAAPVTSVDVSPDPAPAFLPVLSHPPALERIGQGTLVVLEEKHGIRLYGRGLTVADRLSDGRVVVAKWVRRLTNWAGRQASMDAWDQQIAPLVERRLAQHKTPLVRFVKHVQRIVAHVSLADLTLKVPVDRYGVALWHPVERDVFPPDCARCGLVPNCRQLSAATGAALLWRRLGLVDAAGVPTLRGRVVSFFQQGDGLAVAAALEDTSYPLDELIYDFANLDAGFRFCGEDNRWAGRLAMACHQRYGLQSIPGYLENGVPPKYGAGAELIVAGIHRDPLSKHAWVNQFLGTGDIDRVIIEWRSMLRQIVHAPDLDWPRWRALQALARTLLNETESPTLTELPALEYHQTRRVDHRLQLRLH